MKKILITGSNYMIYHFLIPHIIILIEKGYKIKILAMNLKDYDFLLRAKLPVEAELTYFEISRSPYNFLTNFKAFKFLRNHIKREKYDLIITNEPVMSIVTRLAASTLKDSHIKVLYIVHGFHFFNGSSLFSWLFYFPIEYFLSIFTDYLITINREDYSRAKFFFYKKVFYIHGIGFDSNRFRNSLKNDSLRTEFNLTKDSIILLSVGELNKRKNHKVVINAIKMLNKKDIFYFIIGEGKLRGFLTKLIIKLGLSDRVFLLGYRKDIPNLLRASDIFIFPSIREGLGMAALEAMASGLPLIASHINGIKDYTLNGTTGYNFNPRNKKQLAKLILKLSFNSEMRNKVSKTNQEISHTYDLDIVKVEIDNILTEIIFKSP